MESSTKSTSSISKMPSTDSDEGDRNPFVTPLDKRMVNYRDQERKQQWRERKFYKSLPAELKSTFLTRIRAHSTSFRKTTEPEKKSSEAESDGPLLSHLKSHPGKNLSAHNYLRCQREAFHLRHLIFEIKAEMKRMEEISSKERKKLRLLEKHLQEEDSAFEKLLQENIETFVESVSIAKRETEHRLAKTAEMREALAGKQATESAILKNKGILGRYLQFKSFLMDASPTEWKEEQQRKHRPDNGAAPKCSSTPHGEKPADGDTPLTDRGLHLKGPRPEDVWSDPRNSREHSVDESDLVDCEEDPGLYFTDTKQFLHILAQLEDDIISFIHNNQEDMAWKLDILQLRQDGLNPEIDTLTHNREMLTAAIDAEGDKAVDLEMKMELVSSGELDTEAQEQMLNIVHLKVKEVHQVCVGGFEADSDAQQLLASLEDRLHELLDQIEKLPSDKVKSARKIHRKEISLRLHEDNIRLAKEEQERLRMEKAAGQSEKKMVGRKLVFRSQPPSIENKDTQKQPMSSRDHEELSYYLS